MEIKKLPPATDSFAQFWFTMKASLIFLICALSSNIAFAQTINPNTYPIVPLDSLPLNRTATYLSASALGNLYLSPAYKGFKWDAEDMGHELWYPQGITGIDVGDRKFLAVSWTDDDTQVRGSWVSFVDITNMTDSIKYRHVLLVDTNYTTFQGLHAGGIIIRGDTLFVADSRGPNYILKFNLNFIREVPAVDVSHFYNFHYILQVSGKQPSPIYPSSISYDYDQDKLAICTFNSTANPDDYQAGWYNPDEYNASSPYYNHFKPKMQGIASMRDQADTTASLVYISTSYGIDNNSELYVYKHQFVPDTLPGQDAQLGNSYFKYPMRPGLQSLYVEEGGLNIWSLTEYSSGRSVFSMKTADLYPDLYKIVSVDSLPLNRTANYDNKNALDFKWFTPAYKGFTWDLEDEAYQKYRPQGIAGMDVGNRKFLAVSWTDEDTEERGSWISFVDVTNMAASVKYRHVLLVDSMYKAFTGLHAGGIVILGDTLYVADSRGPYFILKFNLNYIKEVPDNAVGSFYDFHYILQISGKQSSPIKPSSISYDYDENKMVMCRFENCGGNPFLGNPMCSASNAHYNQAGWYDMNEYHSGSPYFSHFIGKMQGIASKIDTANPGRKIVWMARSYGSFSGSQLFCTNEEFPEDTIQDQHAHLGKLYCYNFPPGLESLYVEENGRNLWSLTEFAYSREVFCLHTADVNPFKAISLAELPLNRLATKLTQSQLSTQNLQHAFTGFKWDVDDNATDNWRPQGITGLNVGTSKFLVVSWYDVEDGYEDNRGARVSFVNITNMNSITYRHVLLVDSSLCTFPGLGAGGLCVVGDTLYVADSREGTCQILKFDLNYILKLQDWIVPTYFDYEYILPLTGRQKLPIKPSFISYDFDHGKVLAGRTEYCDGNPYCSDNSLNQAGWFDVNNDNPDSVYFKNFIGKMQGMASKADPLDSDRTNLWVSRSYHHDSLSHLYVFNHQFDLDTIPGQDARLGNDYKTYTLAPGLESLYLDENGQNLWSLTLFEDVRRVFCMHTQDVPPPVYNYSQDNLADETHCMATEIERVASTNLVTHANFISAESDWIKCNTLVPGLINSDRSVFAWIKKGPVFSGESEAIVGMNSSNNDICNLYVTTDNELAMWDGANTQSTGITVADSQWHFVGYTYNNSNDSTHVYVDGIMLKKYKNAQHITSETSRISIGQEYDDDTRSNFFNGMITEVSVWKTVLNPTDIGLIKNRSINSAHPKYGHLLAYYSMNFDSADDQSVVKDYSINGNHGTASRGCIQEQMDLQQIPGYNAINHYNVMWTKEQTTISSADTLSFIADATSTGTYRLTLSSGKFTITDDFYLTIYGDFTAGNISSNQVIVQQAIPDLLTATPPTGGGPPYHYQWEVSGNGVSFTIIPGATSLNYQPAALPVTTFYRQLQVSEGGCGAQTNIIKITVVPVPPQSLSLTNQTIANGINECYNAIQTITVGGSGTSFLVQSGGSVRLIAGQNIFLKAGTSVTTGGYLHGYLTSTGDYCDSLHYVLPANPGQNMKETLEVPVISPDNIFDCYPNPSNGRFTLRLASETGEIPTAVYIYNLTGAEILNSAIYSGKYHEFSLEGQPAGIYLVRVLQNERSGTRKIILNR